VRHLPNLICVIRLLLVWPIVRALHAGADLAALVVFIAAAVSDGLDGYLAKRFDWTSELGRFLDPVADKLLLVAVFVECAWLGLVPWWLTAAVVARDVMIGLGALTFWLWFGPLRGRPTAISKVNTAMQLLYVMLVLLHGAAGAAGAAGVPPQEILDACALLTLATTVLSGVHYILTFTRRAWTQPARTA
jgi:cardiolipin synthase